MLRRRSGAGYSARKAEEFWARRVQSASELAAVLSYNLPVEVNEAYSRWEIALVLGCLLPVAGKRVLDLGCGVGRVSVPLAERGAWVTAADNSEEMLNRCRRNVTEAGVSERVSVEKTNATCLEEPSRSFDIVLCLGLLEHLPPKPRQRVIREIGRVTKAGGLLVLVVNNDESVLLQKEERYKMSEQREDGYFCGIVSKDAVMAGLTEVGFHCENVGSNLFQSVAKHLLRGFLSSEDRDPCQEALFALCAELDLRYRHKGDLDSSFADQFVLRAEKVCGR